MGGPARLVKVLLCVLSVFGGAALENSVAFADDLTSQGTGTALVLLTLNAVKSQLN